jgi:hypothetical protein
MIAAKKRDAHAEMDHFLKAGASRGGGLAKTLLNRFEALPFSPSRSCRDKSDPSRKS